jgi:flagellar basal body-associated protein FliL
VKKARLDLLEEMPDIELAPPDVRPEAEDVVEMKVGKGSRWALNKLLLIGVPVTLIMLVIFGILVYYFWPHTPAPSHQAEVTKSVPPASPKPIEPPAPVVETKKSMSVAEKNIRTIYITDFMIDLKDNQGRNRILLCDVAMDIAADEALDRLEDSLDLRNLIYRTTQRWSAVALKSIEERKKLKKELADQIDKLTGKTVVRKVYFLNYFII